MQKEVTYPEDTLVRMACAYVGISRTELARRMGVSRQAIDGKIKRGKLKYEDWQQIAAALGAEAKICIEFPDGKIIE